jgi:hypothetical protein
MMELRTSTSLIVKSQNFRDKLEPDETKGVSSSYFVPIDQVVKLGKVGSDIRSLEQLDKHLQDRTGWFIHGLMQISLISNLGWEKIYHQSGGAVLKYPTAPQGNLSWFTARRLCEIASLGLFWGIRNITNPSDFKIRMIRIKANFLETRDLTPSNMLHTVVEVESLREREAICYDPTYGQVKHCLSDLILRFRRENIGRYYPIIEDNEERVIDDVTDSQDLLLKVFRIVDVSEEDIWELADTIL